MLLTSELSVALLQVAHLLNELLYWHVLVVSGKMPLETRRVRMRSQIHDGSYSPEQRYEHTRRESWRPMGYQRQRRQCC